MGVLDMVWTGSFTRGIDGILTPKYRSVSISEVDDPDNWWEIPSNGSLARRIRLSYPFIDPVVSDDGSLVDINLQHTDEEKEQMEQIKAAKTKEAKRRGYKSGSRVRPLGLMPFLNTTNA